MMIIEWQIEPCLERWRCCARSTLFATNSRGALFSVRESDPEFSLLNDVGLLNANAFNDSLDGDSSLFHFHLFPLHNSHSFPPYFVALASRASRDSEDPDFNSVCWMMLNDIESLNDNHWMPYWTGPQTLGWKLQSGDRPPNSRVPRNKNKGREIKNKGRK